MLSVDSILEKIKQQCTAVWLDRTIWKDPKQSWGLKMMRTSLQIWWASGQACIALKMSLRADHDLANAATQSATDGCSMVIARGSHLRYSNITCDWFKNYGWIYIYIYFMCVCVCTKLLAASAVFVHVLFDIWCILYCTHTRMCRLSSTQGRSLPECSAVDKLSFKWSSTANRARQNLRKWLCNQPLLTPFPLPLSLPAITTVNKHTCFIATKCY